MYFSVLDITIICFLSLIKDARFQTLVERPRNSAALDSSEVTLSCTFSTANPPAAVRWREFITKAQTGVIISRNTSIVHTNSTRHARYNITGDQAAGQYNLRISPFTLDDAGFYACEDDLERERAGAYIMYLTRKTCNATQEENIVTTLVEGEQFMLQCQRDYRSFEGWPPVLEWLGQSSRNITTATNISYEVDLTANETMNNNAFRCATRFLTPPPFRTDIDSDISIPTFTEEDCTTQVEVEWFARNFVRVPEKSVYHPGESVKCQVSANPRPTSYTWNKLHGNGTQSVPGDTLNITEAMLGYNVYECVVTNTVLGLDTNSSHNFTFVVDRQAIRSSDLSAGQIAGIVIGSLAGAAAIAAGIAVAVIYCKKRKSSRKQSISIGTEKESKPAAHVPDTRGVQH